MNTLQLKANIKKEVWEFKKIFFWVPVILAVIMVLMPVLQYFLLEDYQSNNILNVLQQMSERMSGNEAAHGFFVGLTGLFMPFITISVIVQLYYFITCLFDERRDLSVYFWRSLPVSDATSIGVKLFTGALLIPIIFLLVATVTLVLFSLIALVASTILSIGYDISLWHLWANAEILTSVAAMWLNVLPYVLWMLPVYAWLMLASMYAKKAPFLWAILPIAVLLLAEFFVVRYFGLSSNILAQMIGNYFAISPDMVAQYWQHNGSIRFIPFKVLSDKISLLAIALSAGLLYITYWLRVNRSHA